MKESSESVRVNSPCTAVPVKPDLLPAWLTSSGQPTHHHHRCCRIESKPEVSGNQSARPLMRTGSPFTVEPLPPTSSCGECLDSRKTLETFRLTTTPLSSKLTTR